MNIDINTRLMESKIRLLEVLEAKPEPTERDLQQIANLLGDIAKLNEKIEKERARLAEPEDSESRTYDDNEQYCRNIIEKNDIRYSARPNIYLEKHDGRYMTITPQALKEYYSPLRKAEVKDIFDRMMDNQNRKYKEVTYSFDKKPSYVLNLMSMDGWLQPDANGGPPHPIFDLILWSCGGGTQEGYDHLRECILWKYMNPSDFKIPTPVLYREGGAGKNFLFEKVFEAIWPGQSVQLGVNQALGNFNGMMVGRTVLLINEAASDKMDYEAVKLIVHSATLTINEKYGGQYQSDNTPWIWLGCNDPSGAVKLAGGGVDRRWSPIEIKYKLVHWVQGKFNLESEAEAEQWLKENEHVASDKAEVAKWLWHLFVQGIPEHRPGPLRGPSYDDLRATQRTAVDEILELVDQYRPVINWMAGDLLYESYVQLSKKANPRGGVLGRNKFYKHCEVILHNDPHGLGSRWVIEDRKVAKDMMGEVKIRVLARKAYAGKMNTRDMRPYVDAMGNSVLVEASYKTPY